MNYEMAVIRLVVSLAATCLCSRLAPSPTHFDPEDGSSICSLESWYSSKRLHCVTTRNTTTSKIRVSSGRYLFPTSFRDKNRHSLSSFKLKVKLSLRLSTMIKRHRNRAEIKLREFLTLTLDES
jgi:hypothetical protein